MFDDTLDGIELVDHHLLAAVLGYELITRHGEHNVDPVLQVTLFEGEIVVVTTPKICKLLQEAILPLDVLLCGIDVMISKFFTIERLAVSIERIGDST